MRERDSISLRVDALNGCNLNVAAKKTIRSMKRIRNWSKILSVVFVLVRNDSFVVLSLYFIVFFYFWGFLDLVIERFF